MLAFRPGPAARITLVLLITLYIAGAGCLALRRHRNLGSQALDMGYADQVTWNARQGHGLRFTVFRGDVGAELGRPLQFGPSVDRDSLFAYHVELLYFPISLLYLFNAGPETLIVLLTVVLGLGALPAYGIAQQQLRHRGAAVVFAAMYLLSPSIQAANLADFHAVSMSATLLLFALYCLLARRYWPFGVVAVFATAAKEEVGLLVGMMGLYAWLVQGQRRIGLAVAGLSFAWVAVCFLLVIPHFNGGATSLFAVRYADALYRVTVFPAEVLAGRPALPLPDYTLRYVANLLAGTAFLALFGPVQLALAAPAVAINGLSGFTWQHGGGAHYSAEVVPALLVAAIFGTRRLSQACWRRYKVPPPQAAAAIALVGLVGALSQHWRHGILPPAARFSWPESSPHAARLAPLLERIPTRAVVSAQSNVFPHLSMRPVIYVFPYVGEAEYVVADVAGTSDPLPPDRLFAAAARLLDDPNFELLAADDGFLLFRRRTSGPESPGAAAGGLSPTFFSFVRPVPGERSAPVRATLGDLFDVVGYHLEPLPEVSFSVRRVRPTVYVRARRAVGQDFRFTPFVVTPDGIARSVDEGNATQLWYPTTQWPVAEVLRLQYPPVSYGPGDRLGLGAQVGVDAVVPRLVVSAADRPTTDDGRVIVLAGLP